MPKGVYTRQRILAEDRFFRLVDKLNVCGCWIWTGATNNKGYGLFSAKDDAGKWKTVTAHRFSWKIEHPDLGIGMDVCILHRCDNRLCVNPKHLFEGSAAENTADMMRKGRWVKPKYRSGENHHNSKLTWKQVNQIRKMYRPRERGFGSKAIASKYGVNKQTVLAIVRGITWRK